MSSTATVLAYLPSPPQGVWMLGPIPLRAYALCIIAGIIVAIWWGDRRLQARGAAPGVVTDVAVWAVPFGLLGGRLYHVITDWHMYFGPGRNPVEALYIWNGGLGIWGAIALGGVGAWIGCRKAGVPLPAFADAVAPGIVLAQAIGRLGNWFNQELYGASTDLPWGLEIYERVVPGTSISDPLGGVSTGEVLDVVHPTFLYELLWNVLVALVVVWADRRFRLGHGRAFALYVAGYTLGRFWIEQMREDQATRVFGDIRVNVVVSAVVFVGAVVYMVVQRGKPREVIVPLADADGADADAADEEKAAVTVGAGAGVAEAAADGKPATTTRTSTTTTADPTPDGADASDSGASDGSAQSGSTPPATGSDSGPASGGSDGS